MITTKRQIRKDSDRFGGYYGGDSESFPFISDYEQIRNSEPTESGAEAESVLMSDINTDITNSQTPPTPAPTATAETAPTPKPVMYTSPTTLPPRQKKKVKYEKEDLLPTVKTRQYATELQEEEVEEAVAPTRKEKRAIDTKTKVMLTVYVIVALILAIAVIATGVIVSKASAQADNIAGQVAQKQVLLSEMQTELAEQMNSMPQKAGELGMVTNAGTTYRVSGLEDVGYPQATPRSDAFDAFCDWLGKVIS